MLQQIRYPITLNKVRVHTNITKNEEPDKCAKAGNKLTHQFLLHSYKLAYYNPYYLHTVSWDSMHDTPYKGLI